LEVQTKLRHVVLFGFKAGTGEGEVGELVARFRALHGLVPGIEAFEWGADVSPEGLGRGHTHCFTLTFASEAARDAYLVHPDHKAFVERVGPFLEKSLVVDYWAQG
jgi:quinol monooxygenase YgiN